MTSSTRFGSWAWLPAVVLLACTGGPPDPAPTPAPGATATSAEAADPEGPQERRRVWARGTRLTCGSDVSTGTFLPLRIRTPKGSARADVVVDLTLAYRTGPGDLGRLHGEVLGPNRGRMQLDPGHTLLSSTTRTTTTVRWVGTVRGDGRRYETRVEFFPAERSCADGGLFRVWDVVMVARATAVPGPAPARDR